MLKAGLAYGPDGRTIYFLGANPGDPSRSDIYALTPGGADPVALTDSVGLKGAPVVDPNGAYVVYVPATGNQNPFRAGGAGGAGGAGEAARAGGPGGAGRAGGAGQIPPQAPPSFGIVDLKTRKTT